jgi:uncharacterized cupredoxin-like copper-binding protein
MLRFALGRTALFALIAGLLVGACADSTAGTTQAEEMDMEEMMFSFGEPAEAANADRVIEVTANDDFSFDPDEITVSAGEVITFRVVNGGAIIHDFTLGDEATQEEHEAEMAEMAESGEMMMHDEPNAMSIGPGETNEMTWHFTEGGSVLIGCHQVGHYASGMKGTITIES